MALRMPMTTALQSVAVSYYVIIQTRVDSQVSQTENPDEIHASLALHLQLPNDGYRHRRKEYIRENVEPYHSIVSYNGRNPDEVCVPVLMRAVVTKRSSE